jgi:hypothetical protein
VMMGWPSLILTINTIFENSIDTATLGHLKNPDVVDSYTIRITYYKVIQSFILSNDNAKTIRLKAFLNKSEYKTSQSPESFAIQLLNSRRDINELYGGLNSDESTNIIGVAMLKETYVEAVCKKTDKMYNNILDNIVDISQISFNELVVRFNNKYMKEKSRIVTEQLFHVNDISSNEPSNNQMNHESKIMNHESKDLDSNNESTAYYSSSDQNPIKKKGKELPCFNMRDDGKCIFGDTCKFSHSKSVLQQKVAPKQYVKFLQEQRSMLNDVAFYTQGKYVKYKKKYNNLAPKKGSATAKKVGFASPPTTTTKYFEDVGNKNKSGKASAYSATDSAVKEDEADMTSEGEYTSVDDGISNDSSDTE